MSIDLVEKILTKISDLWTIDKNVEITLEVYWSVYIIIFAEDTYIKYYERKEYKYLNKTIQEKLIDYNYVK